MGGNLPQNRKGSKCGCSSSSSNSNSSNNRKSSSSSDSSSSNSSSSNESGNSSNSSSKNSRSSSNSSSKTKGTAGYNIGVRLVDEFLSKTNIGACESFRETAEVIAKVLSSPNDERSCTFVFSSNPLADFVELPPSLASLSYSNLICGVIKGALEQLMKEEFQDDDDA
ncbi:trafficking protein particle complex subunit 3, putative [Eimeria acervulina]|uniref:Trafficking protein particle complex subunit 3, putative n=1 Tax=Eimeria acervulina TaxID=5801 RepID=U6GBP9_EIMAC|nr:trafficking protein particle complex subunit 3, putative [Eimeria acervulina]CDI77691.1 trafficking protein particle complex subunit 3, putative [Eimeria acervulina]